MNLEKLIREGEKKRAAHELRRAKAVHEAVAGHVSVRMNELQHLVGLTIDPSVFEDDRSEHLEAELLEAVNRARAKVDEASGSGNISRRMSELMVIGR